MRKALSQKTRFEVFKRDSFTCVYCGGKPPSIILEVDHIIPVAKKGTNDIDNLATSCFTCNRGKSANELTSIPLSVEEKLKISKEKEKQYLAFRDHVLELESRYKYESELVASTFKDNFPGYVVTENYQAKTIVKFIKNLGYMSVNDAMERACSKIHWNRNEALDYFCGICWNRIKNPLDHE